ncbi:MAG: 3-methyl-2-oxobutanoate hydroxymethyltransferase [Betaproteobacteria bacterium RBG_16_64_18]|nr:MAG: 3-methyl-2-oxobutanoate hydroxymethyltransferase [Betaproteobacteria bacterium RBG_16_64_18]OGA16666.1 MAG: 3-methyl-2-oxobutanoate hydroxymethyltransferase [Betaproteobacteria bacterium RIFCSPLOWO2_02_FULL_65_20]OGA43784.1 MAG: 3-methyl-2-oxobutanoate hydroxymethyltransferase [Betaproteobacteria bacterium RIFCSPLOWO2_12_FULL_65_110]
MSEIDMSRITLPKLHKLHADGVKIAMLTCYDSSFAALLEEAGVECLLIGDSLGMVLQGHDSTLPVALEDMAYHTACVARGSRTAFIIADLPFGSYQESREQAYRSAARLMAAGAHMVKLEGGAEFARSVGFLTRRGIPVCGHLGLTPQSVHQLGGYRVQGRTADAGDQLLADAVALQDAGAGMIVLEAIPAELARRVTAELHVPTIGIGAGPDCSGQVLVLHDMLDVFPGRRAKFVRNFMSGAPSIADAVAAYVRAVKDGSFPAAEHSF